jgi:MerR family mercuric resistance operon transcriptional regulator
LAIGALSRRSGCSVDTIRYYERLGLMPGVQRSAGGHRLYDGRHVERLAFIRRSRKLELSLARIRDVLTRLDHQGYDCAEARTLLARQLVETRRRLAELLTLETTLEAMLEACGSGDGGSCAIIEAMLKEDDGRLPGARCCDRTRSS